MKFWTAWISILLGIGGSMPCFATAGQVKSLTISEARRLALSALNARERRLPRIGIYFDPLLPESRYLYATVTWRCGSNGSIVVDNFAIDRLTADVWSATMSCLKERNAELSRLQIQLRKHMRLSKARYQLLKNKGPLC